MGECSERAQPPGNSHFQQLKLREVAVALKIHGKLRQLDTWVFRGGEKELVTWKLETSDQVGLLSQLVTLSELFNLSDPQFPPLQIVSNNAHLLELLGRLSRINYVEVFGTAPGTKQASSWLDVNLIRLETLVAPISPGN